MTKQTSNEVSPEFKMKWDKDFQTILAIGNLADQHGEDFVLKGGFAAEAYLGGRQRRSHGDVDATYYLNDRSTEEILIEVKEILESEKTKWEVYAEGDGKLEYREQGDSRNFFDRRRLEIYLKEKPGIDYETKEYEVRQLVDSQGNVIRVKVMVLSELIAMKMRNIYMSKNNMGNGGRESTETDYQDLEELLNLQELDRDKVISKLSKLFKKITDESEAKEEAMREYEFVTKLLASRK